MKKVITLALFAFPAFSMAFVSMPKDSIGKTKVNGKLHVQHRVEKGEGLLAICRKYNVKKEDVLKANEGMTESLNLGQVILIPYSTKRPEEVKPQKTTVNETHAEADAKETTPTDNRNGKNTHTVMAGETMYRIAKMYNISEADLRTWNNLSDNSLKEGLILFIKQPANTSAPVPVVKKDSVKTPSPKANEPHPMASSAGVKEREESGVARWFADDALSGGKLLALHKTAPIGTIIKLTNHLNNKSVFVRVVGVLPDTDENKNIIIKISRSTAERIGMRDEQTHVKLNYSVE